MKYYFKAWVQCQNRFDSKQAVELPMSQKGRETEVTKNLVPAISLLIKQKTINISTCIS